MPIEETTLNGNTGRKSLILNAFVETCKSSRCDQLVVFAQRTHRFSGSGHQSPGLWRHPDDQSVLFNDIDHWTDLAKLLERGKFHGMFIADVLGTQ